MTKPLAVVVGFIGKLPMSGMTAYNVHYIAGLAELGYRVHYVEHQGAPLTYYDPVRNEMTDSISFGLDYLRSCLQRRGITEEKFSLIDASGQCHGSGWPKLRAAIDTADFVLDIAEATWFEELGNCPRRAFVDGDPMFTQAAMLEGGDVAAAIANYDVLFTYGARIGKPGCTIPDAGREWIVTRPVVSTADWTPTVAVHPELLPVTNVLNWSAGSSVQIKGTNYDQKGPEFERFMNVPARGGGPFLVAVGGPAPRERMRASGWGLVNPLEVTSSDASYRAFIAGSRADFGVVKNAYIKSKSGWFSDRSICYLASGRPVLHQDTGFHDWLPAGDGIFAFDTEEEVSGALDELRGDYARHAKAARAAAEDHFEARTVIAQMLRDAAFR